MSRVSENTSANDATSIEKTRQFAKVFLKTEQANLIPLCSGQLQRRESKLPKTKSCRKGRLYDER